jgi:hypothetical protein
MWVHMGQLLVTKEETNILKAYYPCSPIGAFRGTILAGLACKKPSTNEKLEDGNIQQQDGHFHRVVGSDIFLLHFTGVVIVISSVLSL